MLTKQIPEKLNATENFSPLRGLSLTTPDVMKESFAVDTPSKQVLSRETRINISAIRQPNLDPSPILKGPSPAWSETTALGGEARTSTSQQAITSNTKESVGKWTSVGALKKKSSVRFHSSAGAEPIAVASMNPSSAVAASSAIDWTADTSDLRTSANFSPRIDCVPHRRSPPRSHHKLSSAWKYLSPFETPQVTEAKISSQREEKSSDIPVKSRIENFGFGRPVAAIVSSSNEVQSPAPKTLSRKENRVISILVQKGHNIPPLKFSSSFFVRFIFGSTSVETSGSVSAVWNETLQAILPPNTAAMDVQLRSRGVIGEDIVGLNTNIELATLYQRKAVDMMIDLADLFGNDAGSIHVILQLSSEAIHQEVITSRNNSASVREKFEKSARSAFGKPEFIFRQEEPEMKPSKSRASSVSTIVSGSARTLQQRRARLLQLIKLHPLLGQKSEAVMNEAANACVEMKFGENDVVFSKNDAFTGLYFIDSGECEVFSSSLDSPRIVKDRDLFSGAICGDSVSNRSLHQNTVICKKRTRLWRLPPEKYIQLLQEH